MENTVNMTTGTILLRASFDNKDLHLFPGQFVDVILAMPPAGESVMVPARAIQTTQRGQSVYVLKPDGTVALTKVEVGQVYKDNAAIQKGVAVGDVVVTDGQMQLTPGAHVRVQKENPKDSADQGTEKS